MFKNPLPGKLCLHCKGQISKPACLKRIKKELKIGMGGYLYYTQRMLTKTEKQLCGSKRNVLYHRYVMSMYLGRKLRSDELVRHINGDKKDCRIENLILGTDLDNRHDHRTAVIEMLKWKQIATALLILMANANG